MTASSIHRCITSGRRFPVGFVSRLFLAIALVSLYQIADADATQAAGGNAVRAFRDADGVLWQAHMFTDVGAQKLQVTQGGEVEYLIVAGGGAGGSSTHGSNGGAAGGGGGGVVYGTRTIAAGSYDVVVGAGGEPVNEAGAEGRNGANSSIFGMIALGGGGGGGGADHSAGADGGSGGGGGRLAAPGGKALQLSSESAGIGYSGARGPARSPDHGSGGGGAGGSGSIGNFRTPGIGGEGFQSNITGTLETYATGGRGGARSQNARGAAGRLNRGDGGGGGAGGRGSSDWSRGGDGGSGFVVIRYKLPPPPPMMAEGGDVTTYTDDQGKTWRVHSFTTDGAFTILQPGFVEVLLVGGGGGGSTSADNGSAPGGAGGAVVTNGRRVFARDAYNIFVGTGGKGAPLSYRGTPGMNGDPSTAFGFVAAGGRGGNPLPGGSIGGRGAGGTSPDANGGPGIASNITGILQEYGGGGGTAPAEGHPGRGTAGGGDASNHDSPGRPGIDHFGGGGGGANHHFAGGGDGGSGIVIIRYPEAPNRSR